MIPLITRRPSAADADAAAGSGETKQENWEELLSGTDPAGPPDGQ